MPALGSADCFHDLSAATAVRAGPTVNAPAAMTVRADILARPGCSVCGLIAGIERLTGIGCMHPDLCTSAFILRVLRVVPRHSCLLTVLNAPISRWLPLMAEIDGRKADIRHSWPHCEAAPSVRRYLEPMNFQSAAKVLVRHSRRCPTTAAMARQRRGSRLKKPQMKKSAVASVGEKRCNCEAADGQPRSNPIGKARFGLGTKQS